MKSYLAGLQDLDFDSVRSLASGPSTYVFSKVSQSEWRQRGRSKRAKKQFSLLELQKGHKQYPPPVLVGNPQRFKIDEPKEECRIEVCRVDSKHRFFPKSADDAVLLAPPLCGFQQDSSAPGAFSANSFINDSAEMLESTDFTSVQDELAHFGVGQLPTIWQKSKFPPKNGKFRSLKSHRSEDFEIHQFGDGRPLLFVSSTSDSSCIFNGSPYETDLLFDRFKNEFSGKSESLDLNDYFPHGIDGKLKLIGVEKSLIGEGICNDVMEPIVMLSHYANLESKPVEVPLLKFLKLFFVRAIPIDFKAQSSFISRQQTPIGLQRGKYAVTTMSVSEAGKSVTYCGVVK